MTIPIGMFLGECALSDVSPLLDRRGGCGSKKKSRQPP